MLEGLNGVLPYRCDADDLARWIEARARGRTVAQIRALGFSAKVFEGTIATASALGLVESSAAELTERGRAYAVASAGERQRLVLAAMKEYEPYGLLLEAILLADGPQTTELSWIGTWWAAHNFGSSESNRGEAATVFGRLVEFAGLGNYVQGRRGHPTRIEWNGTAADAVGRAPAPNSAVPASDSLASAQLETAGHQSETRVRPGKSASADDRVNSLTVELGDGRVAHLSVPAVLTRAEKNRLLSLLDLLISVAPDC